MPENYEFESEWVCAMMSFPVRRNTGSKIAVANCTELSAQDGTVKIKGRWQVMDLAYIMVGARID